MGMSDRRRRSFGAIRDASAYGGKVSGSTRPNWQRPAGVLAWYDGRCWICDRAIVHGQTMLIKRKEDWICAEHAVGADDE